MPDNISRKRLKKKVLDRWENEGGSILADQTGAINSDEVDERAGKGTASETREDPAGPENERVPDGNDQGEE